MIQIRSPFHGNYDTSRPVTLAPIRVAELLTAHNPGYCAWVVEDLPRNVGHYVATFTPQTIAPYLITLELMDEISPSQPSLGDIDFDEDPDNLSFDHVDDDMDLDTRLEKQREDTLEMLKNVSVAACGVAGNLGLEPLVHAYTLMVLQESGEDQSVRLDLLGSGPINSKFEQELPALSVQQPKTIPFDSDLRSIVENTTRLKVIYIKEQDKLAEQLGEYASLPELLAKYPSSAIVFTGMDVSLPPTDQYDVRTITITPTEQGLRMEGSDVRLTGRHRVKYEFITGDPFIPLTGTCQKQITSAPTFKGEFPTQPFLLERMVLEIKNEGMQAPKGVSLVELSSGEIRVLSGDYKPSAANLRLVQSESQLGSESIAQMIFGSYDDETGTIMYQDGSLVLVQTPKSNLARTAMETYGYGSQIPAIESYEARDVFCTLHEVESDVRSEYGIDDDAFFSSPELKISTQSALGRAINQELLSFTVPEGTTPKIGDYLQELSEEGKPKTYLITGYRPVAQAIDLVEITTNTKPNLALVSENGFPSRYECTPVTWTRKDLIAEILMGTKPYEPSAEMKQACDHHIVSVYRTQ